MVPSHPFRGQAFEGDNAWLASLIIQWKGGERKRNLRAYQCFVWIKPIADQVIRGQGERGFLAGALIGQPQTQSRGKDLT
jgi:hypothetical protein